MSLLSSVNVFKWWAFRRLSVPKTCQMWLFFRSRFIIYLEMALWEKYYANRCILCNYCLSFFVPLVIFFLFVSFIRSNDYENRSILVHKHHVLIVEYKSVFQLWFYCTNCSIISRFTELIVSFFIIFLFFGRNIRILTFVWNLFAIVTTLRIHSALSVLYVNQRLIANVIM